MIRQVMDIYTLDNIIEIDFGGTEIFGLQIIARNLNQELGFIHEGNVVKVNISNLNWPDEMESTSNSAKTKKHVKLEIKYFMALKFRDKISRWDKIISFFKNRSLHSYIGRYKIGMLKELKWIIRPEFTIKLPLGLKMLRNEELNLEFNRYYPNGRIKSGKRIYPYIIQYIHTAPYIESFELNLKDPDITRVDGKRLYTFVIDDKDYNEVILETTQEDCVLSFHVDYNVVHENRFLWIPIFGLILVPFAIFIVAQSILGNNGISQATVIVAVLSYFILFLTLKREEYELPMEKAVNYISGFLLILFIIWILFVIYLDVSGILLNTTVSNLTFSITLSSVTP